MGARKLKETLKIKPNILFLMVDEERYPPVYETEELKEWKKDNLITHELLKMNGIEFLNHYVGSTACSPSRTTLYTGQYPSLHGVSQTTGAAKDTYDPDVFWLDPNTVPTMGDYFRAAGYKTFWIGKWHASAADILIPGTHDAFLSYNSITGVPQEQPTEMYKRANRLEEYGFSDWVGPEPHGNNPRNSGSSASIGLSGRDEVYADEAVELIQLLDENCRVDDTPWFIMCSLVNPHDIALYGVYTELLPQYNFEIDQTLPLIPQAPTANESLATKPDAQESYRVTYPKAFQPINDNHFFRQLYYTLQKKADEQLYKVFQALKQSSFYENTIVVFTSDHGDLLGAHGGLFQKWYNVYEEAIHVPLIIHNPRMFPTAQTTDMLTSHVDILPTLLGLADINEEEIRQQLAATHTEARPLVGRNLQPIIEGHLQFQRANEPLYFMTDDDVTKGLHQTTITGERYESVVQPNHIEAVIVTLKTGKNKENEIWKFARYYDDPQFWTNPSTNDLSTMMGQPMSIEDNQQVLTSIVTTKTCPAPDQFEMYNLSTDPLEVKNLADPAFATNETKIIEKLLLQILKAQSEQKRLTPRKTADCDNGHNAVHEDEETKC